MDSVSVIQPRRPICFCADGNYLRFVVPAIESIERADPHGNYEYHVISDLDMPEVIRNLLQTFLEVDRRVHWHQIDAELFEGLKEVSHFTKAMYYRLSIPEVIDSDKVLYLDCDVVVRKSLTALFDLDLADHFAGAVINPFFTREDLVPAHDYFNSGVLLINCAKWRAEQVMMQVLDVLRKRSDIMEMPDQDALNLIFSGNWLRLDWTYNSQMAVYLIGKERGFFPEAASDPAIVHFSATNKQWHKSCGLVFTKDYRSLPTSISFPKKNTIIDFLSVVYRYLASARSGARSFFYIRF